jgi:hypothetical protein
MGTTEGAIARSNRLTMSGTSPTPLALSLSKGHFEVKTTRSIVREA